jgi:hypothetical protein
VDNTPRSVQQLLDDDHEAHSYQVAKIKKLLYEKEIKDFPIDAETSLGSASYGACLAASFVNGYLNILLPTLVESLKETPEYIRDVVHKKSHIFLPCLVVALRQLISDAEDPVTHPEPIRFNYCKEGGREKCSFVRTLHLPVNVCGKMRDYTTVLYLLKSHVLEAEFECKGVYFLGEICSAEGTLYKTPSVNHQLESWRLERVLRSFQHTTEYGSRLMLVRQDAPEENLRRPLLVAVRTAIRLNIETGGDWIIPRDGRKNAVDMTQEFSDVLFDKRYTWNSVVNLDDDNLYRVFNTNRKSVYVEAVPPLPHNAETFE